jgi:magnesium chelatase accessory protein
MALSWHHEAAHWPHAAASRFVAAGGWHWHVQHFVPPRRAAGATSSADPGGAAPSARAGGAVLLLHGTGASSHSWRHLVPLLAARHEVIAPDLPGHAFTRGHGAVTLPAVAAAVARLVETLDRPVRCIVGHSAGAAVGAQLVLGGHLKPRALVAINGALLPLRGPAWPWFSPLARWLAANPLVPHAFAWHAGQRPVLRRLLDGTGSALDAEGVALYGKLVADPDHVAGALRLMAAWELEPLARTLPGLATPLTLVTGAGDRTLPPEHARRVQALLPAARLIALPRGGHLVHEEDAAGVLAAFCAGRRAPTAAQAPGAAPDPAPAATPNAARRTRRRSA